MKTRPLKVLKLRLRPDTSGFPTYRAQWNCLDCLKENWLDLPGTLLVVKTVQCQGCGCEHEYNFPVDMMERIAHDRERIAEVDEKLISASAQGGSHEVGTLGHLLLSTSVPHLANWLLRSHDEP